MTKFYLNASAIGVIEPETKIYHVIFMCDNRYSHEYGNDGFERKISFLSDEPPAIGDTIWGRNNGTDYQLGTVTDFTVHDVSGKFKQHSRAKKYVTATIE